MTPYSIGCGIADDGRTVVTYSVIANCPNCGNAFTTTTAANLTDRWHRLSCWQCGRKAK